MITSIADIRARHGAIARQVAIAEFVQRVEPAPSAAEWIATVDKAQITRTRRADGGYELHVGRRRVALVEGADKDGAHVVINLAAGRIRSPALPRAWADTLALRIARNEALA